MGAMKLGALLIIGWMISRLALDIYYTWRKYNPTAPWWWCLIGLKEQL